MIKTYLFCCTFLVTVFLPSITMAEGFITGKVIQVRTDQPTGQAMIIFERELDGTPPACVNASYKNVLALDTATAGGKAALSTALMAKMTNASVHAAGKNGCGIYGGTIAETLDYITIQ